MGTYNGKYIYEGDPHLGDPYRAAYLESIKRFIEKGKAESFARREEFIPAEELVANPEKFRETYLDMIGSPLGNAYTLDIPRYEKEYVASDDLSDIYRLKIEVFSDFYFYGMLMTPKNMQGRVPLVVAQHGGGSLPEICSDMNGTSVYGHFTKRALERGMAVFAPQLLLWRFDMETGENRVPIDLPFNRKDIDTQLIQLGLSITGLEVFCIRRSIDCLTAEKFIDGSRVGMMGLSYGGYFTLFTAAADTRIKSAYAAGFFNDRTEVALSDWKYKNQFNTFCDAEVAGLVAPRKLAIDVGETDPVFNFTRAPKEAARIEKYYNAYGCPENFRFSYWGGGHRFDESGEGFEFFFRGLEGET